MMCLAATASRWSRAAALAASLLVSSAGAEPLEVRLPNGIQATIHSPDDILATMTHREQGSLWMTAAPGVHYELISDIDDPAIVNRGDGSFHPMSLGTIVQALSAISFDGARLVIDVYVLPYPRREVLDSSARDGTILLSPGTRPVSEYAVHFTVSHEVGHVFQYQWLPDADARGWRRYSDLRGIQDAATFSATGEHRNRPHEIFAEDFRFLFGGEMANYSGGIENDALRLPTEIDGLEAFIVGLTDIRRAVGPTAHIDSSPNPFNPSTEIRVRFETVPAERARLRVFDAQGHEVRRLYDDVPAERQMQWRWDGRTTSGALVASGLYFARLDYLGESIAAKLLLVK